MRREPCARENYSLERIAPMYEEYLQMVLDLHPGGFYAPRPERAHLDWLRKRFPTDAASLPKSTDPTTRTA